MSASLTVFERVLLEGIWMVSTAFAGISTLLMLLLALRRVFRDRKFKVQKKQAGEYAALISAILSQRIEPSADMLPVVTTRDIAPVVDVLLKYLRNFSGPDAQRVISIIGVWEIEPLIAHHAKTGRRGGRIEALTVLSYLESERSLKTIANNIHARDTYVQLAAIRCLARRGEVAMLPEIIEAVNHPGQYNRTLLADVLQRFGQAAVPYLAQLVSSAVNETVRAAALEALILISPPDARVDFGVCLESGDEKVRAAAITLAGITGVRANPDPISLGVRDGSALVRARCAGAIKTAGRTDLLEGLLVLFHDPVWWVRYRASQALMEISASGRALLRVLAKDNDPGNILAREVLAEAEQS